MRNAWLIALNNLRRVVRQPVMLFTTLALPFVIVTVIGVAIGDKADTLSLGVVSQASDAPAHRLVTAVREAPALDTTRYADEAALRRAVRRGQVTAGLVVPAGYGAELAAGRETGLRLLVTPRQPGAATVRSVVAAIVSRQVGPLQAGLFAHQQTGRPLGDELARARQFEPTTPGPAVTKVSVAPSDAMRLGVSYTGPSNLTLFVVITSLTSAAALIESRQQGITRRMLAMPVSRTVVLGGEFLGRVVIAALQALVIWAFCALVFHVDWGDPLGVAVLTGTLCLFGASLGMVVGLLARTTAQAIAIGPPVGVALGMLGGCMWPLDITGDTMRTIGHLTPHAWAMDGYVRLINTGGGLREVLPSVSVIAAMTLPVLALVALTTRRKGTR